MQDEDILEICTASFLQLRILYYTVNNLLRGQISYYMGFFFTQLFEKRNIINSLLYIGCSVCVCVCVCVCQSLSSVELFATPWTVAHPSPLSMAFSRQEYWTGQPFPSPGNLPDLGLYPGFWHYRWIVYHLHHQGS